MIRNLLAGVSAVLALAFAPLAAAQTISHPPLTYPVFAPNGSATAPSYSFQSFPTYGLYFDSSTGMVFTHSGVGAVSIRTGQIVFPSTGLFGWTSGAATAAPDLFIARDAANVLAQRNGTAAQTFNVYNTYTDASNYELGAVRWTSNVLEVGVVKAGTGSNRDLRLKSLNNLFFDTQVAAWQITTAGYFLPQADNTYDIGASGTAVRNIWAGGQATVGTASGIIWNSRSIMKSPADGEIVLTNNAATGFTRLSLGGTTNSFPSLRATGTTLAISLAGSNTAAPISVDTVAFPSGSKVKDGSANGNLRLSDNAETSFGLLQLGGVTSSYPAIKRSSAAVQVRLADDTGYASLTALNLSATGLMQHNVSAVSALVVCNAGAEGSHFGVTDATQTLTAGIGATVAGGGANHVPVYCNGTNWIIGDAADDRLFDLPDAVNVNLPPALLRAFG